MFKSEERDMKRSIKFSCPKTKKSNLTDDRRTPRLSLSIPLQWSTAKEEAQGPLPTLDTNVTHWPSYV